MARRRPTPFLKEARGTGWRQRVAVEGTEDVRDALLSLDREVSGAALLVALDKGADVLQGAMSSLAPRDTGELAENIGKEMTRLGSKRAQIAVAPEKEAFHGIFQELGTSEMPAQPFMRPALDTTRDTIVQTVVDELRVMIARVVAANGA